VRRVADALTADDVRAPNGRVREVPDARAIRWYSTIGLVDRPAGFRGRTALYGRRHLLQAVAVKRRQAQGLALAQIQAELAGATDATLRQVARVPDGLLSPAQSPVTGGTPPPATPPPPAPSAPPPAASSSPAKPQAPALRSGPASDAGPHRTRFWAERPANGAEVRYRVPLGGGVLLDLPSAATPPSARDLADLTRAAEPLIRMLAERGLLTAEEPRHDDHRPPA